MKTLKKTVAVLFSCVFLLCAFPLSASAMTIYSGDFGFEVNTNTKTATLVAYKGTEENVSIPAYFRTYPVTVISRDAFSYNSSIKSIEISENATKIDEDAFRGCSALQTVAIPENVTDIGRSAFMDCSSLETATVSANIAALPNNIFAGCTKLQNVTLSDSIEKIGTGAFSRCTSLEDLDFLNNVSSIGDSSFFKNGFTNIEIPETITSLPYYSFAYSNTLSNVIINTTVTYIHPNAFTGSENVVINCYTDSCAHVFAVENSIPYILLDGPKLGDVNGDGNVDILDSTEIQKYAAEMTEFTDEQFELADINDDGFVDVIDALLVQKYVVGKYDIPPIIYNS